MRDLFKWAFIFFIMASGVVRADPLYANSQVFFSSEVQLDKEFIRLIDQETKSIEFAVFHFSHYPIADALLKAYRRGVEITLVVDTCSIKKRSAVQKLIKAGIPVQVWHPPEGDKKRGRILMHHKFCLFGEEKVWSGSCNFTRALGSSHRENALVVLDRNIVESYKKEFKNLLESSVATSFEKQTVK